MAENPGRADRRGRSGRRRKRGGLSVSRPTGTFVPSGAVPTVAGRRLTLLIYARSSDSKIQIAALLSRGELLLPHLGL